jgi:hypothetical protein
VSEYPVDDRRINGGDNLDLPAAVLTGFDVYVQYLLQTLHPRHRRLTLGWGLIQPIFSCGLALFAPLANNLLFILGSLMSVRGTKPISPEPRSGQA